MKDQPWLKLLDMLQKRLGARDARIEIGGRDPDDPRCVWAMLEEARRVVMVFEQEPRDRPGAEARLLAMLESFRDTVQHNTEAPPVPRGAPNAARRELDHALTALGGRTGAETVWIIDIFSPVIWGSSESIAGELDLDALIRTARADQMLAKTGLSWAELLAATLAEGQERLREAKPGAVPLRMLQDELQVLSHLVERGGLRAAAQRLRAARALAEIRQRAARDRDLVRSEMRGPAIQCFAHAIAGQYQLVLVFDETYSPLHAEANLQRALPHVERLLLSLPPVDPLTGGSGPGKVIRLPRKS